MVFTVLKEAMKPKWYLPQCNWGTLAILPTQKIKPGHAFRQAK